MNTRETILILGRPGSGKGTQTKILSESLSWKTLSSGDRIKEIRDGSGPFAINVRETYDKGHLLPDWVAMYIFEDTILNLEKDSGIVCEGFGRRESQAVLIEEILGWCGRDYIVISLDVSEQEAMRRMLERSKVEHRPDSNDAEKIQERFDEFSRNTQPALEYFKKIGKLVVVNGEQSQEAVAMDIQKALAV